MRKLTKKSVSTPSLTKKSEFRRYLERVENNNQYINYDLPENPTPLQAAKFNICQNILAYQQDHDISDKELATRMNLSIPEMEEILFCQIEKFTLDRLMTYTNHLFAPAQVKITITKPTPRKRNSLNV